MWVRTDAVDTDALLGWFTGETCAALVERMLALRASGKVDPKQFSDVRYADLVKDPIPTLAGIYDHFGIELSEDTVARMRRYLAANPKNLHGRHRYSLEAFGLDRDEEIARYAAYSERFGLGAWRPPSPRGTPGSRGSWSGHWCARPSTRLT